MKKRNKLGVLINTSDAFASASVGFYNILEELLDSFDVEVMINYVGESFKEFHDFLDSYHDQNALRRCKLSATQCKTGNPSNADLRCRYISLDADYIWLIDDDFDTRRSVTKDVLKRTMLPQLFYCINYMDENPTCSLIRFKNLMSEYSDEPLDDESVGVKLSYPVTSTSLAGGILFRSSVAAIKPELFHTSYRCDDYSIILNLLDKGYGLEAAGKLPWYHNMAGTKADLVFPKEIESTLPAVAGLVLAKTEKGDIKYSTDCTYDSGVLEVGAEFILKKELSTKLGWMNPGKRSVVENSRSSMLNNLYLSYDIPYRRLDSRALVKSNSDIQYEDDDNILIVSAGTKSNSLTESLSVLHYNIRCIDQFIDHNAGRPCMIIYMGSVAKDRLYPNRPYYAGNKSYMYAYLGSIKQRCSNVMIHYITIPSCKTNMCDHGIESDAIKAHVELLIVGLDHHDEILEKRLVGPGYYSSKTDTTESDL